MKAPGWFDHRPKEPHGSLTIYRREMRRLKRRAILELVGAAAAVTVALLGILVLLVALLHS